ncbi:MAG: RluA family pseudouridine synthase [Verrucomicrobiota bacterium]
MSRTFRIETNLVKVHPDWVVAIKPAPLLIHPTRPDGEYTFWQALQEHFPGEELCLMNRLDRETSGLVLASRHRATSSKLGKMAMNRRIQKSYYALVHGTPPDEGLIDQPLGRKTDFEPSPIYVLQIVHPQGKAAQTRYRRVETRHYRKQPVSLVEVELLTGRMHQIRVHFQFIGHPIIGDKLYGPSTDYYLQTVASGWNDSMLDALWLRRQALHAHQMAFMWNDEPVRISIPLPDELAQFWKACDP